MLKLVLIGALIYVVVRNIKRYLRRSIKQNGGGEVCDEMIKCAKCGSYIHRNSAIVQGGDFECQSHSL